MLAAFFASFFSNAKMMLGAATGIVVTIFLAIFKARGKEIKEQQDQINELEREAHLAKTLDRISEEVHQDFLSEEQEIEEEFNEKDEVIYKSVDKPLTPTLLSKLRSVQGLQNNRSESPE